MKKSVIWGFILSLSFFGCSDDTDQKKNTIPDSEYTNVALNLTGEILEVTTSPLLKSGNNNDLYAIQVHSKSPGATSFKPYSYGFFDDVSNLRINLLKGYEYKFVSTMIKYGKHEVCETSGNTYGQPFIITGNVYAPLTNQFVLSSKDQLTGLVSGKTLTYSGVLYDRPHTDRYFGETIFQYLETYPDTVFLDMKRVVYGVEFKINGLTEGRIRVAMQYSPDVYVVNDTFGGVFTFRSLANAYKTEDYFENVETSIFWERTDSVSVPLAVNYIMKMERKKLHTIRIDLEQAAGNNLGYFVLEDDTLEPGSEFLIGDDSGNVVIEE